MGRIPSRLTIFDVDGTLLLSGPVIRTAFREAFQDACGKKPDLERVSFAGRTDRGIFRGVMAENRVRGGFEGRFASFARRFTERLREVYPGAEGPHLLPGVVPLLKALRKNGDFALALGTGNIRETAYIKLGRFGLKEYFPVGGFGGEHESRVDILRAAMDAAGRHYGWKGTAREAWVVGDTPEDVAGARKVGARALVVATGFASPEELEASGAEAVLPDLGDTRKVLSILGDAR